AIKRGLTPDAALAAVTTAPAKMLGIDDVAGAIAPGKLGNVIIATGDLFTADSTAEITDVWVDGDHFETAAAEKVDARGTWKIAWHGATAPDELKIESRGAAGAGPAGGAAAGGAGGRPRARLGEKDLTMVLTRNQLTLLAPAELFQGKDAKGTVRLAGT